MAALGCLNVGVNFSPLCFRSKNLVPDFSSRNKFDSVSRHAFVALKIEREDADVQSGEWPENVSILNFQDFLDYIEPSIMADDENDDDKTQELQQNVEKTEDLQNTDAEIFLSGEWPLNFSILNFEDMFAHYAPLIFKSGAHPSSSLADIMSRNIYCARPSDLVKDLDQFFEHISGLTVVDEEGRCVGLISKSDRKKIPPGSGYKVSEVMSSPAITLTADKTVSDAAVTMLTNKIHRIPIVNQLDEVVGIVTRTDIFAALENGD